MSTPAGTPKDRRYTRTHEWVRVEAETAYIGITDYAQEALGDIVFVELPPMEESFRKDEEVGTVESVKAASPIFAPAGGTIVEVNDELEEKPEMLNQEPWEAFIYALRLDDPEELSELLDAAAYDDHVEQEKTAH
jgi:glycine cleavage system H protein